MLPCNTAVETVQGVRPLSAPNLPVSPVSCCCVQAGVYAAALQDLGVRTLSPAPCGSLPPEERSHADQAVCAAGGGVIFAEPGQRALKEPLTALGYRVVFGNAPGGVYPKNVTYNAAVFGELALARFDCVLPALRLFLEESGKTPVNVRQGYAKCALCAVSEKAFITEDRGMAAVLRGMGRDVLLISPGDVALSEAHYGFFGGASGLIAPDRLAVTGSLSFHRDGEAIRAFLKKHGVRAVELTNGKITDIGGVLPLTEEIT